MLQSVSARFTAVLRRSLLTLPGRKSVGVVAKSEVRRETSTAASVLRKPSWDYFWAAGSGHYGKNWGTNCRSVIDNWDKVILSYIDSVPVLSASGVFTIGDYGTCDGFASLKLMHKIIRHLRSKHGPDLNIQVLYEDQERNDFNSLFKTIYDGASFLSKFDKVFLLACATEFFKQCVPDNSCDIIICTTAVHWLSDKHDVRCSESIVPWWTSCEKEREDYLEVCRHDWQQFLLHRAAELKPGGLLVIIHPALSPSGSLPAPASDICTLPEDQTCVFPGCIQDILLNYDLSWKKLYKEGVITTEEFQACTLRMADRTSADMMESFKKTADSPVWQAGLRLIEEPEPTFIPCSFKAKWRERLETDGVDDRVYFADLVTRGTRIITETAFQHSLLGTRTADEKSVIIERLYEIFRGKVAAYNPEFFRSELVMSLLIAQKIITQ